MNADAEPDLAAAGRVYAGLTLAYPRAFREAYGPLMIQLFCDQYRAACAASGRGALTRFWLHTLADLAASVMREQIDEFRGGVMSRESPGSIALGVLVFAVLGGGVVMFDAPIAPEAAVVARIVLFFGIYLAVVGLLLIGWLAGFPRWVYPCLGYAFIFPLYLSHASTPGIEVFGIPIWGTEAWSWRAFVPLGLAVLLALSLHRPPWDNLVRLVSNIWDDWTLAVFGLFGLLPLALFISLDEVASTFAVWPHLAGAVLLTLGAFLYMRLTRSGSRYLALLACTYIALAVLSGSTGYYWETHDVNLTTYQVFAVTTPVDWGAVLLKAVTEPLFGILFLLLPLPLALARRAYDWSHAQPPSPHLT
jgi:hypothetical protein